MMLARMMLAIGLCFISICFAGMFASAQEPGPTLARPPLQSSQGPAAITAETAAKVLADAYQRTKNATASDEFGDIIETCERALSVDPPEQTRQYARQLAAWAYNRRGELYAQEASKVYNKGAHRRANELDALALDDFQAAIGHDATKWKAIQNRGVSLALHGKLEEAIADFDLVLKLQPEYQNAWFNRAELRFETGEYAVAISDYNQALQRRPDDIAAMLGRGESRLKLGQPQEAKADFELALRYSPTEALALAGRGDAHTALRDWNRAGEDYREAIRFNPRLGRAYRGAAWLLATCPDERYRRADLAVQTAEKAIELGGDSDWTYLDTLAAAQASAGQYDEAAQTIAKAIQIAPENLIETLKSRLDLYAEEQPFRLPAESAQRSEPTFNR